MTSISLIVAMDEAGLIGAGNGLPWRLPNDMKHFKRTTLGKPVLMGRKTWESLGKPLVERENLVLSRDRGYAAPGARVVPSLDVALMAVAGAPELMVIGGAEIYALALPRASRIYLTRVQHRFEGDTWFPPFDPDEWELVEELPQPADERNPWPHSFQLLERR